MLSQCRAAVCRSRSLCSDGCRTGKIGELGRERDALSGSKPFGMKGIEGICKIAGVQAEPVMFDKRASLEKALRCIGEAAAHHPNLIVFPSSSFQVIPLG